MRRRNRNRFPYLAISAFCVFVGFIAVYKFAPLLQAAEFMMPSSGLTYVRVRASTALIQEEPVVPSIRHVTTPEAVKAIYMSQCVVGTPSFREKLVELVDTTELNSIVIDI
ncbi:MAG: hypothetical protein RIQ56_245, partial [Candidatus Parcubacteria bacterium]